MNVKVVKIEFQNIPESRYYYEVFSCKKKKMFSGDIWVSEQTFFSGTISTDEEAKERAIKYADELLKPRVPLKPLKLNQIIYEKSNERNR